MNTMMYDGIWDGMYMLPLIAFAIGNACFGAALLSMRGLARVVGGFILAACVLTVVLFINELGFRWCRHRCSSGITRQFNHLAACSSDLAVAGGFCAPKGSSKCNDP